MYRRVRRKTIDNTKFIAILKTHYNCRGGEIGRHAALRWLWEKSHRGSSPLSGTRLFTQPTLSLRSGAPKEVTWDGDLKV
jgi:hypothetical protein